MVNIKLNGIQQQDYVNGLLKMGKLTHTHELKKLKKIYIPLIANLLIVGLIGGIIIGNIIYHPQNTNNNINEINKNDNTLKNTSSNPTWHKIKTYTGVNDDSIQINTKGSKIKIVSTAMPVKNYFDNSLTTILNQGSRTVDMSQISWNSKSAVATKTKTIEVSNTGNFEIEVSTYELEWWTVEVYEYY